jgi:hypothetical protein
MAPSFVHVQQQPQCNGGGGSQNSIPKSRHIRSASIGALGGSQSLGLFQVIQDLALQRLPRSYSVSADITPSKFTAREMGRRE